MTLNQTQAGQIAHAIFANLLRQTTASVMPTISASAACRLGIAAYGFDASSMSPLPWFSPPMSPSVSAKPKVGNMRGGAVGMSTYPSSPITFASRIVFRNWANALVPAQVDPEQRQADDGELRVPVGPRHGELERVRRRGEVLERKLEEVVRVRPLPADDAEPVRERPAVVVPGHPACDLVDAEEAEPDRQLEAEMAPAARQVALADCCDGGGHVGLLITTGRFYD